MKIMIASDIHGSAYYCGKLMENFKKENPGMLLLLGDLLYHGPRNPLPKEYNPKQVFEMLNGVKDSIVCVRGNCDSEVDQMVLEFPIMSDSAAVCVNDMYLFASHGHIHSPEKLPPLKKGAVFASGHIHIPVCKDVDGILCINPGSVSLPKEDTPNSFMIVENNLLEWKNLEGETYKTYNIAK